MSDPTKARSASSQRNLDEFVGSAVAPTLANFLAKVWGMLGSGTKPKPVQPETTGNQSHLATTEGASQNRKQNNSGGFPLVRDTDPVSTGICDVSSSI